MAKRPIHRTYLSEEDFQANVREQYAAAIRDGLAARRGEFIEDGMANLGHESGKNKEQWLKIPYHRDLSGPVRTLKGEELERVKAELLAREAKRK